MDKKDWRKRFKNRVDLSSRVTHLTKGDTDDEAFENLISILKKNVLEQVRQVVILLTEIFQQFVCKKLR